MQKRKERDLSNETVYARHTRTGEGWLEKDGQMHSCIDGRPTGRSLRQMQADPNIGRHLEVCDPPPNTLELFSEALARV